MKYRITDIIKILPSDCQVENIDRIVTIILDFLIYMKAGDEIVIPGNMQLSKIGKAEILLPDYFLPQPWSNKDFHDVVKMLQEYRLLKEK